MKKLIFTICLLFGLSFFSSQYTFACSCRDSFTPLIVHYSRTNSVFVGKVMSIKKLGNIPKEDIWRKNILVEFEIQKVFKGIEVSTKRISLITNTYAGTCGSDKPPRIGQKWIVFVYKNEENNHLYFGGMCDASNYLETDSDLSYYEDKIASIKEKQAIIGTLVNDAKDKGIKNIEVTLEGEGQKFSTKTNENGLYYFPVSSKGNYKITINIPFPAYSLTSSFSVEDKLTKESADEYAKPLNDIVTYYVQLKDNEFHYNEIDIYVLEPTKNN